MTRILVRLMVLSMLLTIIFPAVAVRQVSERAIPAGNPPIVALDPFASVIGVNVPIVGEVAPDRQQVEPTIAIDPRNPTVIAAGAQDLRLLPSGHHRWHGFYRSTDGGSTWTNVLLPGFPGDTSPQGLASPLKNFNATSDTVLVFDRYGNLYYAGLGLTANSSGVFPTGLFVAKFANDGALYEFTRLLSAGITPDKPWIAVDNTGGQSDGNVYVAYDANLTATQPFATLFVRSTDGGSTWSTPFYAPPDMTGELAGLAVDPSGIVYVSVDAFNPITQVALGYVEVTKITSGGSTIVQTTKAVNPVSLIPSPLPGGSFRTFTIPQIAADKNGVYLVWDDFRSGTNSNVFFTRSTDGGTTWSSPLMLNDVTTGQHFFPTIAVAGGIINVAWYDSRLNSGTTMTALDVFYAQSLDGGVSFSANLRVTSASFNPELVERTDFGDTEVFMGDYVQVAASQSFAQVIWSDNRNACDTTDPFYGCVDQDAYAATISLPDYTMSESTADLTILQGSNSNGTVTLTSTNGFQGSITITSTSSPPGLPISPVTKIVQLSSGGSVSYNLKFSPSLATTSTTYTVNISSVSGPRSHSVYASVLVEAPGVGGGILNVDKLTLLTGLLVFSLPIISAFTLGIAILVIGWRSRAKISFNGGVCQTIKVN